MFSVGDLNDFIQPSQACVNPIVANKGKASDTNRIGDEAGKSSAKKVTISLDYDELVPAAAPIAPSRPNLIKKDAADSTAKISLNDCLACSGCVTSAETVLITQQSVAEVMRALGTAAAAYTLPTAADGSPQPTPLYQAFVASFSPQAIASLAVHYGMEDDTRGTFLRLRAFLKQPRYGIGFDAVVDTVAGAEISLAESAKEFVERYRQRLHSAAGQALGTGAGAGTSLRWEAPTPTVAVLATTSKVILPGMNAWSEDAPVVENAELFKEDTSTQAGGAMFPLLASSCPGWVCYAEKTVPEALPFISRVKSPQQVTGTLVKHLFSQVGLAGSPRTDDGAVRGADAAASASATLTLAASPSSIYHVTVEPCFDRKLEASRRDFSWLRAQVEGSSGSHASRDGGEVEVEVDCVLTTGEVIEMLNAQGLHLADIDIDVAGDAATSSPKRRRIDEEGAASASSGGGGSAMEFDGSPQGEDAAVAAQGQKRRSNPDAIADLEALLTGCLSSSRADDADDADGGSGPLARLSYSAAEGSSDGYADYILRHAAMELWGARAVLISASSADASDSNASDGHTIPYQWTVAGRNPDLREAVLHAPTPDLPPLRFALAYGFRNIQAVVQRMKKAAAASAAATPASTAATIEGEASTAPPPSSSQVVGSSAVEKRRAILAAKAAASSGAATASATATIGATIGATSGGVGIAPLWDYVEVMACPAGCANGGGQARPVPAGASSASHPHAIPPRAKAPAVAAAATVGEERTVAGPGASFVDPGKRRVAQVKAALEAGAGASSSSLLSERARAIYRRLQGASEDATLVSSLLRTQYHNVPKLETGLTAKW